MLKSILILAENLDINRTSSGLRSNKHILIYSQMFEKVDVLTSTPLNLFKQINSVNYTVVDVKIESSFIDRVPKSNAMMNYLFGITRANKQSIKIWQSSVQKILQSSDYDLVLTLGSGASFIPAYAMQEIKKVNDIKHLMFIHDPYPLNQYPPPYQKKNSLAYQSVANRFGKVISSADIISFPSLRLKEWMSQYYPSIINESIIQPHIGLTQEELKPILPINETVNLPKFNNGIDIVHTGTLLGPRNPLYLIEALKLFFEEIPEAKSVMHLHIIGKMTKDWKDNSIADSNIHVYDKRFSYLSSLKIQQNADILLLLEAVSDVSPFMPGKLADYFIAKKPILALTPRASETTRLLGENYPLLAENGDIEQILIALRLIYSAFQTNQLSKYIPESVKLKYVRPEQWQKELLSVL
jgi:glycosyltransferase involved in cell wall biosynthesis